MRISLVFLMAFSLLLPLSVNAQADPVLQKIVEIGQTDNRCMEVVMDECSVVYGLAMLDHKLSREGYYIEKAEEEK